MRIKLTVFLVVLISVISFLLLRTKRVENKRSLPVVKVAYGLYVSPFFVAQEKGFFEQEGIKVEMQLFPGTNTTTQALAKGDIDIASLPYSMLFPFENASPGNFKIFAGIIETKEKPYSFLIAKDEIKEAQDLKGKKVVTRSGSNAKMQAELIFKGLGIDPKQIELVQVESPLTVVTFAQEDIKAAIDVEPSATAIIEKKLGKVLISAIRPKYIADPYPTTAFVYGTKFLQRDKQSAEKFRIATEKAIDFMNANDKESRMIMQKYLNLDETVALLMSPTVFQKLKDLDKGAIEKELNIEFENGILKQKPRLDDIYYQAQ